MINWQDGSDKNRSRDRFSYDLTGNSQSMISALVKLSKDNLLNLPPSSLRHILLLAPACPGEDKKTERNGQKQGHIVNWFFEKYQ